MQPFSKYLCFVLLFVSLKSFAQKEIQDSIASERLRLNQTHLYVLGAWATANIVQGSISASNTTGKEHYVHQMNAYWNTVNLAIAGAGLYMVKKQMARKFGLADNLREQAKIEKLLLLNTGLDAAYIMTGLYLKERGARVNSEQSQGYGTSLLLQGGFLLVFDLIQYGAHRKNGKLLDQSLSNWQLGSTQNGVGLSYRIK